MAQCGNCGATILFGGVKDAGFQFCNARCQAKCRLLQVSKALPDEIIHEHLLNVHGGPCPHCQGPGPIDVYTAHRVWSAFLLTSSSSQPQVSCRSCGVKHQAAGLAFCAALGWWGFPWGLILTPIQIMRNVIAIMQSHDPALPSVELEQIVRMQLASALAAGQIQPAHATGAPPTAPPTSPPVAPPPIHSTQTAGN